MTPAEELINTLTVGFSSEDWAEFDSHGYDAKAMLAMVASHDDVRVTDVATAGACGHCGKRVISPMCRVNVMTNLETIYVDALTAAADPGRMAFPCLAGTIDVDTLAAIIDLGRS